ncbi:MAG: hypothetical protein AAGF23_15975 [Acidobacteriota bacterium]
MKAKIILASGVAAVLVLPPAMFLTTALRSELGLGASLATLAAQYVGGKPNLGVVTGLGAAPLLLLGLCLWLLGRFGVEGGRLGLFAASGLAPILAVILWVQLDYWPHFFPDRRYPGFPHGLELIIGPFVFAPAGMALGLLTAWAVLSVKRPTASA